MAENTSLRRRILRWLFVYAAFLTICVVIQGIYVNEHVERLVWRSSLSAELGQYISRKSEDPGYRWRDTPTLSLYDSSQSRPVPEYLAKLGPGVHDEFVYNGNEHVAFIDDVGGTRYMLVLNIDELERDEGSLNAAIVAAAFGLLIVLMLAIAWALRRLVRPLSDLAERISRSDPSHYGQRIVVEEGDSSELRVIGNAFNDYVRRNEEFVARERAFIDTTSHELRTPIAVIAGAAELALNQEGSKQSLKGQIQRIHRTACNVEQLISLLLVLAKDPARLSSTSDRFMLDQLIPEVVEDHLHLTKHKDLTIVLGQLSPCEVVAPVIIVQAALGNLIRNAIENSDRGVIRIGLDKDATVTIEDPGHGMSPEEISEIYAKAARGGGRDGGGIGLDLIARLCEHLGWNLIISSEQGRGTVTTLKLGP